MNASNGTAQALYRSPASSHPKKCPSCGHCPTCGRGGAYVPYPSYPYYPGWYGTSPYTVTYNQPPSTGTYTTQGTATASSAAQPNGANLYLTMKTG